MRSLPLLTIFSIFLLVLTACGGGGGGGDGARNNNEINNSSQIVYAGNESPGVLEHANALRNTSNALSILDMVLTFSELDYLKRPWFLTFDKENPNESNSEDCISGSLEITQEKKSESTDLIVLNFHDCAVDDGKFNGSIRYEVTASDGDFHKTQNVNIPYLAIEHSAEKLEISGQFQYYNDGFTKITGNLTVHSRQQNRMFKIDNLSLQDDYVQPSLSARFLDSQDGAFQLSFEKAENTLQLLGNSSTKITLQPHNSEQEKPPFLNPVTEFLLTLNNGSASGMPISTKILVDDLLEWPYHENLAPAPKGEGTLSTDRLSSLAINASEFFEDSNDLLDYRYSIESTSDCDIQKDRKTFEQMALTFECQGVQTLTLTAVDGQHESSRNLTINVQPLAASLAPISNQEISSGQTLSIPLSVANLDTDGPFTYSIAQGPAGLTISPEGIISGAPKPMINEGDTHFNVNVQAFNGKASNISFEIKLHSDAKAADFSPVKSKFCSTNWEKRLSPNRYVRACSLGASYIVESLQGSQSTVEYAQSSPPVETEILFMQWMDVNNDNKSELVIGYADRIVVYDDSSHQIIRTINLPVRVSADRGPFLGQVGRIKQPLIMVTDNEGNRYIFNIADGSYQTKTFATGVTLFGDIDADGKTEISLDDGTVIELDAGSSWHIPSASLFEASALRDLDGNGSDEFIRVPYRFDPNNNGAFVVKVARDTNLSSFQTISIPSPLSGSTTWEPYYGFFNVDGQPGDELLLRQEYDDRIYIYKLNTNGYQLMGSIPWDGNVNYEAGMPLAALPDGFALSVLNKGLSIINLANGESSLVEETPMPVPTGDSAKLFREDSGKYSLFISDTGRIHALSLNSAGDYENINASNWFPGGGVFKAQGVGLFDANNDGTNEYVGITTSFVGSWDDKNTYHRHYFYNLVNAATVEQYSNTEVQTELQSPIIADDFDHDGVMDLFALDISPSTCISWYRFGSSLPSQTFPCADSSSPKYSSEMKFIDLDHDGTDELIALHKLNFDGFRLVVYKYQSGQFVQIVNYSHEEYGSDARPTMGVQDVDADGELDIVVAEPKSYYDNENDAPRITVIEQSGNAHEVIASAPVDVIPDILTPRQSASLVAADLLGYAKLATRYFEIGTKDGAVIWASKPYSGELIKGGFNMLDGSDGEQSILAVTKAGIMHLH